MLPEIDILNGFDVISTPISVKSHHSMSEIHCEIISSFVEYMKQTSPGFKYHSSKLNDYGGIEFKISCCCPIANRWHLSHWMYACIEACGRIKYTCPDVECRKYSIYLPFTLSYLIRSKQAIV
jgi:hypothetical protein